MTRKNARVNSRTPARVHPILQRELPELSSQVIKYITLAVSIRITFSGNPVTRSPYPETVWLQARTPERAAMVWYGMVEVCEGAPVAVSGWVLADRHDLRPCAASSLHRGTISVSNIGHLAIIHIHHTCAASSPNATLIRSRRQFFHQRFLVPNFFT